jgi:hypothetical protein
MNGKNHRASESLIPVDITPKIAEIAGHYKRTVKSQQLELDDCFIAASAIAKRAPSGHWQWKTLPHERYRKESCIALISNFIFGPNKYMHIIGRCLFPSL